MGKYEVSFKSGSTIFEEGALEDTMYFIKRGKVEIVKCMGDAQRVLAILGPGDFFGEMALVSETPRSAAAKAASDTTAIVFNRKQFLSLIKVKGEVALKILDGLILRLIESNETVRKLIQKNQTALVFDCLSKWLQLKETPPEIQEASEWAATQLGMKTREAEAVIRKLVMMDIVTLTNNRVALNTNETTDRLKSILEE